MKIKQWLFTTCVVFYVANHVLLAGATPNITILENTALGDAHVRVNNTNNASVLVSDAIWDNTTALTPDSTPIVSQSETPVVLDDADDIMQDNVSVDLNDIDNTSVSVSDSILDNITAFTLDSFSSMYQNDTSVDLYDIDMDIGNTTNFSAFAPNTSMHIHNSPPNVVREKDIYDLGFALTSNILVQGTASMRLKSTNMEEVNIAISTWYTYCEEYMKTGFENAGFSNSQLSHTYDWVQIDNSTLDVFFVGKIVENSGRNVPSCLSSNETLQNVNTLVDACSFLTLGGFGQHLITGSRTKLTVLTNVQVEMTRDQEIRTYVANSMQIPRMSCSFSSAHVAQQRVRLQAAGSLISIFDGIIVLRTYSSGTKNSLPLHCPEHTWSVTGQRCGVKWLPAGDINDQLRQRLFGDAPRQSPDLGEKGGAGRDLCFQIFNMLKMQFDAAKTHCESNSGVTGLQGGKNYGLYQPLKHSEAEAGLNYIGTWPLNIWSNHIRNNQNADCDGVSDWTPNLPHHDWWDSSQPSCQNDQTVLQIRSNRRWNDEKKSNTDTFVMCQHEPGCTPCSTAKCPNGEWRTGCYEHQNSNLYAMHRRSTDNECLKCHQPSCPVYTYRLLCDGWGTQHGTQASRENKCPLCTYGPAIGDRVRTPCPSGKYSTNCPGTLDYDNTCLDCDHTPCSSRPATEVVVTEFGYYRKTCTDDFAYTQLRDSCVACSQKCVHDLNGLNGGDGWWRAGCNSQDFNSEPACSLCGNANELTNSNVCPPTKFLVLCVNGYSEQFENNVITRRVGKNSCNSCPPHMFAEGAATSVNDCKCSPGARPKTDAEKNTNPALGCVLCAIGKYGAIRGSDNICLDCESSQTQQTDDPYVMSTELSGSANIEQCLCPENFYKQYSNSVTCLKCDNGKISPISKQTGKSTCVCDTVNGWRTPTVGFTCLPCEPGTSVVGGVCTACAPGTYRGASDPMTQCRNCEPGMYQIDAGGVSCNVCSGLVSSDRITCELPKLPTISAGMSKIVFLHFKANTPVRMILDSVTAIDNGTTSQTLWRNGDYVQIYANGTRGLNPLVLFYNNLLWIPANVHPMHNRDNVYVISAVRDMQDGTNIMSITWQRSALDIVDLSLSPYTQTIDMQPYYLRKHYDPTQVLSNAEKIAQNSHFHLYEPMRVRIINNLPTHTTNIEYDHVTTAV